MTFTATDQARDLLMKENPAFRELVQLHHDYETRLNELAGLTYPNDEEILEESTLKKKKLAVKDQIYTIMQRHSSNNVH